ncbi:necrosis inducing protein [Colletotrichum filicis]|nr:necrosis inducing protein [Colletotrichum filicis]
MTAAVCRVRPLHERFAVLCSYYLPKVMGDAEQHRHHWLTAVVWFAFQKCPDEARSFSPRGISYSTSPGQFDTKRTTTLYVAKDGTGPATHPLVTYDAGQILFPSDVGPSGALSPLVGWHRLPQRTKDQFNGIEYEHTKVPFSDGNFQAYLDAAYNEAFYDGVSTAMDCGSLDPQQSMIDPDLEDMPPAEPTAPPS